MSFLVKAGVVACLLVGLLTWLMIRGFAPENPELVATRRALDTLAVNESLLHADVLRARAGLRQNYDPLVREIGAMRAAAAQLVPMQRELNATGASLADRVDEAETALELFKSDNALLQNCLVYFDLLSDRVLRPGEDPHLSAVVGALDTAVAHLSRDASPDIVGLVRSRIEAVRNEPVQPDLAPDMAGLIRRGEMLVDLLPRVDALLRKVQAASTERERRAIRSAINARESADEASAGRFRLALFAVSLVLAALVLLVCWRLTANALALRKRSDLEHLIALSSNRFIACQPEDIPRRIDEVLGNFGRGTGADRVYVVYSDGDCHVHLWSRSGIVTPDGWPEAVCEAGQAIAALPTAVVRTPDENEHLPAALLSLLERAGVRAWSCAKLMREDRMIGLLCFDRLSKRPDWLQKTGVLLRMEGDVIGNALHRQFMFGERRALEARIRQGQRLEAIGTFTSGVAHNFNNVIGTVLGHAEMAADAVPPDSSAMRHVEQIAQAGERARDLVGQILDFGRRGRTAQFLASLDALRTETVAELQPVIPEVELVTEGTAKDALVVGEPAQLQQVLVNLIHNAAQASAPGSRITIGLARLTLDRHRTLSHGSLSPGSYVRLSVQDEGKGMDAATLAKIFEPFFTTRSAGTGLGLATALEVVNESGGGFHVDSAPGRGSRFEVWLPEAPRAALDPSARHAQGVVMLVGADAGEIMGDEEILAALGVEPVGFADPRAALRALRASPTRFDLVMVDAVLPDMGGLDFAREARTVRPGLPVVLSVSVADRIEAEELTSAGIADVARRPWRSVSLAATLARNLKPVPVG